MRSEQITTAKHTERNYLFDNLKAILIFLVVFAHIMNVDRYPCKWMQSIYTFIYFFHMPAFIFVSGYFSKKVDKCREHAVQNYFVPYVLLVIICYIQIRLLVCLKAGPEPFRLFTPPGGCWYLFTLFIWKFFIKDIAKLRFGIPLFYLVGLLSAFSDEFTKKLSLSRLCFYTVFFVLGFYMNEIHIKKISKIPKIFSILFFVIVGVCSVIFVYKLNIPITQMIGKYHYRDHYTNKDFMCRIIFYIISTLSIFALINLVPTKKTFLCKLGKNTYGIYIFHLLMVRFIDYFFRNSNYFSTHNIQYLIFILISSILITYIFSRDFFTKAFNTLINLVNRVLFKQSPNT